MIFNRERWKSGGEVTCEVLLKLKLMQSCLVTVIEKGTTNKTTTIHSLTGTTSSGGGSGGTEPKCFSRLSRSVNFIMITVLTHSFTDTKDLQLSANLLIILCLCLSHTWSLMQVCKPLHDKH